MAIGLARVVGKGARATTWALAAFGAGVAVAAIFRADPVDGFPAGTHLGPPTDISTMGLMHFPVSALAFTCFGVSALLAAPVLARRGELSMSRLSLASGQGSGTAAWVEMWLGVWCSPVPVCGWATP